MKLIKVRCKDGQAELSLVQEALENTPYEKDVKKKATQVYRYLSAKGKKVFIVNDRYIGFGDGSGDRAKDQEFQLINKSSGWVAKQYK